MNQILIIDDAQAGRVMLAEALSTAGYRCEQAPGIRAGLEQALKNTPDLIICDVCLADGRAYDLLEQLQHHPQLADLPVILISGLAIDAEAVRKGMDLGADDYLVKPFRIQTLLSSVAARLRRRKTLLAAQPELADCFTGSSAQLQLRLSGLAIRSAAYCLMALGMNRFERCVRMFGRPASEALVQTLVSRLLLALPNPPEVYPAPSPGCFYLLWPQAQAHNQAQELGQRVLGELARPLTWADHELHLSAQAGLVIGPGESPSERADLALLRATEQGAGSVILFETSHEQEVKQDFHWQTELHQALAMQRFELFYQPQFELASHQLIGAEALLRLRHPRFGMVSPAVFIPIAEACGLMDKIGSWVLATACRQLQLWRQLDAPALRLAVNVSQLQLQHPSFYTEVAELLNETGLGSALELELTESLLMQDPETTRAQLFELKALGLSLAMDDFGTGYSSLAQLSQLPFDLLKIDQSFVRNLSPDTQAIPQAIISMGHSLGLKVLAEGIETPEQLELLRQLGCDYGQGYLYSRPLPARELPDFWARAQA